MSKPSERIEELIKADFIENATDDRKWVYIEALIKYLDEQHEVLKKLTGCGKHPDGIGCAFCHSNP